MPPQCLSAADCPRHLNLTLDPASQSNLISIDLALIGNGVGGQPMFPTLRPVACQ